MKVRGTNNGLAHYEKPTLFGTFNMLPVTRWQHWKLSLRRKHNVFSILNKFSQCTLGSVINEKNIHSPSDLQLPLLKMGRWQRLPLKGLLILKCLFCVFTFFQKTNKNKLTSSKVEFVCSFFERNVGLKNHFEFVWPLLCCCLSAFLVVSLLFLLQNQSL